MAPTTYMYVGTAKMFPDSRRPRRFATVRSVSATSASSTRQGSSSGMTEVTAAMPAATETATVIM